MIILRIVLLVILFLIVLFLVLVSNLIDLFNVLLLLVINMNDFIFKDKIGENLGVFGKLDVGLMNLFINLFIMGFKKCINILFNLRSIKIFNI